MQLVDRDAIGLGRHRDRHDLLGEHVQRVARHDSRLDQPLAHPPRDHRALQQVAAELGEDAPDAHLADAVPGAADPLQPARHRLGRLDLQHEVDGAHVDPELQRARRDQARQLAGLQQLLDLRALLARERAVVCASDLAHLGALAGLTANPLSAGGGPIIIPGPLRLGELVQAQRHALGRAAVVDEDDRRAVLAHQRQQLRVDGRPDRPARRLPSGQRLQRIALLAGGLLARFGHRLDRHLHAQVKRLAHAGVDDRHLAPRADEEAPDLLQRILRRAQPDPLHVTPTPAAARLLLQALERERQVRAALGVRDGVDLVDDHRLDAAEHLAGARGEDQVQRLGRRDQDVGRPARHRRALALGRVAGADAHAHLLGPDAAQRRAQVSLDVIRERLQRAHVHDARAARPRLDLVWHVRAVIAIVVAGAGGSAQAIERPQEGGERLARPGRRG